MQSLIRSKSAGVTGGRGTAGAGPGRDLLYPDALTKKGPQASNLPSADMQIIVITVIEQITIHDGTPTRRATGTGQHSSTFRIPTTTYPQ